jgi:hypothetical protein
VKLKEVLRGLAFLRTSIVVVVAVTVVVAVVDVELVVTAFAFGGGCLLIANTGKQDYRNPPPICSQAHGSATLPLQNPLLLTVFYRKITAATAHSSATL